MVEMSDSSTSKVFSLDSSGSTGFLYSVFLLGRDPSRRGSTSLCNDVGVYSIHLTLKQCGVEVFVSEISICARILWFAS